jgi:hypothetical protein
VSDLLDRAASYFVAPAGAPAEDTAAPPRFAPRAVVLGKPGCAAPVAAALANELRIRVRARCALACVWAPAGWTARSGPAGHAARRLAEKLEARGLSAVPRGRLAWLPLPSEPVQAGAAAARAAAAVDVPVVVALAGPRSRELDGLLDEQDLLVVVPPDRAGGPIADLALAGLADRRAPAVICPPLPHGVTRVLALAGLGRLRGAGDPMRAALRVLR